MATFTQLEALVAVVDHGTFEGAATRLGLVQSAITRQIQDLEHWLGFALFDRSGRSAKPTPQAAEVVAQARQVLLQREIVYDCLIGPEVLSRTLRIGITELSALTWLPRLVQAIAAHYPKVRIEPEVELSVRLHALLVAGQVDVIVVPDAFNSNGLVKVPLDQVHSYWFCAPGLLDHRRTLSLADLSGCTLLTQGKLSGSGLLVDQWLATHQTGSRAHIPCSSLAALVGLTVSGLGVTYLPDSTAASHVASGQLVKLAVEPPLPVTPYVALARADCYSPFHRHVIELMSAHCDLHRPYHASAPT
ncbi:LysR family transcriptional regulator [Pseudomonas sp. SDO528_S397]